MPVMSRGRVVSLVKVNCCEAVTVPDICEPKDRLVGETRIWPSISIPLTPTFCVAPVLLSELSVSVTFSIKVSADEGAKSMLRLHICPGLREMETEQASVPPVYSGKSAG